MLSLGLALSATATRSKRPGDPAPLALITPSTVIAPDTLIQGT